MLRHRLASFLLILLCTTAASGAATIRGRVTGVADGDSFTMTDSARRSYRVRIQGIDAPEKAQSFSYASKKSLSDLLYGREVTVLVRKTDQYGRIVGTVTANGRDAGLEQLRSGLAWFYAYYGNEMTSSDRALYLDMQRAAKAARRGLWSEPDAQPPWRFRRNHPRR